MAEKSSSSSSSGIDKALEGEPITTWTCPVLKAGVFAEPECMAVLRAKRMPRLEADRSLVTKGWSVISTESLPRLVFTELSSVTKTPRLQRHWKSSRSVSGRSEADDQTTMAKSDDSTRKGAPLAPTELPSDGVHFAHLHSVWSTLWETFFVVAWPYQIKRNCLSFFWKKKLVWFCEWAIIIMSGCSCNFFSEPFCEMHPVVTVKTVVNFNDANTFCTTRNKIRCWQFVMRSWTINLPKNRRCRWNKKVKDNSTARECDEKSLLKENMMLVNQPSESANQREVRKKGDWKRTMLVNAMIRIFLFWKTKHDACEATVQINKQQMKEVRKKKKVEK